MHNTEVSIVAECSRIEGQLPVRAVTKQFQSVTRSCALLFVLVLSTGRPVLAQHFHFAQEADIEMQKGNFDGAERLYMRALSEIQKEDPGYTSVVLWLLGDCYLSENKFPQAEAAFQRGTWLDSKQFGTRDTRVAKDFERLADLHQDMGKFSESKKEYKRASDIYQRVIGSPPELVTNYARLLRRMNRPDEAKKIEAASEQGKELRFR